MKRKLTNSASIGILLFILLAGMNSQVIAQDVETGMSSIDSLAVKYIEGIMGSEDWGTSFYSIHLLDVNGDGYPDIVLPFHSPNCGGNYGVNLYLFDSAKNNFVEFTQVNPIWNASFDLMKHTVTSYFQNCSDLRIDDALKLKWRGLDLDTIEHISASVLSMHSGNTSYETIKHDYKSNRITKRRTEFGLPEYYFRGLFIGLP